MAGLRARTLGTLYLASSVMMAAGAFVNSALHASGAALWWAPTYLALGLWTLWLGRRLGDLAFLGVALVVVASSLTYLPRILEVGSGNATEYTLLSQTIVCAVFCGRRWHLAVELAASVTATGWLGSLRIGPGGDVPSLVLGEAFTFIVVTVVVRLLRDLARDALAEAKRGEVTDPMTGLTNRRGLERYGERRWTDQASRDQPLGVLVVDIDWFKQVNDTLGHAAGDEVIRQVAEILRANVRQDDLVVRLGGEEFAVLASATPGEAALTAERLRSAVELGLHPLTVSIGVYEGRPSASDRHPEALWRAVDLADRALYEAKRAGRNCVVSAA
ncbi:MAG TPA: GGDEF domain-containing protein [Kineosporiaceae bacterium]|jgi:diguanylate cyclase (GGDEF)-like protein|nr:GGDEF domain-containing protein [Kineosporiaceae bacterium]